MSRSMKEIRSTDMVFLSNDLLNPTKRKRMKLPLIFVSYAFVHGKMYSLPRSTFVVELEDVKTWGNNVVYGAVYLVQDWEYFIDVLDAYHCCSKKRLHKNHKLDLMHRKTITATLINFDSFTSLEVLKYKEVGTVQTDAYFANMEHNRILKSIYHPERRKRLSSGISPSIRKELGEVI